VLSRAIPGARYIPVLRLLPYRGPPAQPDRQSQPFFFPLAWKRMRRTFFVPFLLAPIALTASADLLHRFPSHPDKRKKEENLEAVPVLIYARHRIRDGAGND
jgi:hypothetical protein